MGATAGPDICIIGAGSSGVAVGKALKQAGLAFDCFEKVSDLALPGAAAMQRGIARHRAASRRYVNAARCTPEVDCRSSARSMARDAAADAPGT